KVNVRQGTIPESYPVLTVNTAEKDTPDDLLGTFIHENMHLFIRKSGHDDDLFKEFKEHYPDAPTHLMEGGYTVQSTYDHIPVCWLEYKGLEKLVGPERAKKTVLARKYYTWMYKHAIEDSSYIESVMKKYGTDAPLK